MKVAIEPCDTYLYREVWRVVELKDGCIFKTKNTHKFIHTESKHLFSSDKYQMCSISMSKLKQPLIELDMWDFDKETP